jgi:predicted DNA-binding protein
MIRTMIQLTEEQLKALKELAKTRKTSVAKLVRESVTQYVTTVTQGADREEKRRRALEFIRKIKSGEIQSQDIEGKTDVAKNHDKYLAKIYGSWKKSS